LLYHEMYGNHCCLNTSVVSMLGKPESPALKARLMVDALADAALVETVCVELFIEDELLETGLIELLVALLDEALEVEEAFEEDFELTLMELLVAFEEVLDEDVAGLVEVLTVVVLVLLLLLLWIAW